MSWKPVPAAGIAERLASAVVRRPVFVALTILALTALSGWVLVNRTSFDSDILNLLPPDEPAVQGLRDYERHFTQSNELAFVLHWASPPENAQEIREAFAATLSAQPWALRVLANRPMDGSSVNPETNGIVLPLLLNLPAGDFQKTLENLDASAIEIRLSTLVEETAAGSPRAAFELEHDPLGLAKAAMTPLWESVAGTNAYDLASPDGTVHIVPCITNQVDESPEACRQLMALVHDFVKSTDLGPAAPEILVTGRAAYVAEISSSMERDVKLTSLVSLTAVVGLFWLGFRRIIPLVGIALLLMLSAVIATACGSLIFGSLNVIAIGFCSILFGLGDDFSLLICQRYYQAAGRGLDRRAALVEALSKAGPGILWVALTTGAGFLALCFAGSPGFRQLGALVAIGVVLATLIMLAALPLFLGDKMHGAVNDSGFLRYAEFCMRSPVRVFVAGGLLSFGAVVLALSPWRPIHFDLTPASLEPSRTPAARALALMMSKFPDSFEPVIAVIRTPSPATLKQLDLALERCKTEGLATSFSSPTPLVLDPETMAKNRDSLRSAGIIQASAVFSRTLEKLGLEPRALEPTHALLQELQDPAPRNGWKDFLSKESPWWFLTDRMVAPGGQLAAAQIRTPSGITVEQRLELSKILTSVPGVAVTGWSQTLASLVPWARSELLTFGGLVLGIIAVILIFVYRDARHWALHLFGIAASLALAATILKILNTPINILNVLAVPLVLGVGVDYGTHIILAVKESGRDALGSVLKPVLISGLTTVCGFGALIFAANPALSGLGAVCAVGVGSCLVMAFILVAPGACLITRLAAGNRSR